MEKLLTVLSEVRADIDYRETDDLIDGGYFESIDIISCIAAIEDAFDISMILHRKILILQRQCGK